MVGATLIFRQIEASRKYQDDCRFFWRRKNKNKKLIAKGKGEGYKV